MSRCLNLTKSGEYAIAALSRLALEQKQARRLVPVRVLAGLQHIPDSFLAKILGACLRRSLLVSSSGPRGGVGLSRPAESITLLEIIEACEGSYRRDACVFYSARPCDGPECTVYCPLRKEEEELRNSLGRVTLADMARSLDKHPDRFNGGPL